MTAIAPSNPWVHPLLDVLLGSADRRARGVLLRHFHPFLALMLWSVILAVTLYRSAQAARETRQGRAARAT
jgi:hypothetical protein